MLKSSLHFERIMEKNLKQQLQDDLATAMREGDVTKRDTLRMLNAAIKQEEIDRRIELDDAGVEAVLTKQAKQRRESIDDAKRAERLDLVADEEAELAIVESYLPQQMSEDEIRELATNVINDMNASGSQDMGRVMGRLMPELGGRADGRLVSQVVRELLNG
jgi:uncharacterized protein YqeY